MRVFLFATALWATSIKLSNGVSTKMDFGGEDEIPAVVVTNSSQLGDGEDVEVKHTIVVSTKLKNNNRRGITSNNNNGDTGTLSYNIGDTKAAKEDSGEVPVYKSYRSVETTRIRTPDSRYKTAKVYPDAIFVSRNIRDENDVYPFVATSPLQWKPASFYNNINYASSDGRVPYDSRKRANNNSKFNRKVTDEDVREFYCQKCLELSNAQNFRGCPGANRNIIQHRSANSWVYETTTPKMKIDGKLAKLN